MLVEGDEEPGEGGHMEGGIELGVEVGGWGNG